MDKQLPEQPLASQPDESPGASRPVPAAVAAGVLALLAAGVTLFAAFLPVIEGPTGESLGYFSCQALSGCTWLGAGLLAAAVSFVVIGLLLMMRTGRELGASSIATGAIAGLGCLGWARFHLEHR